MKKYRSFTVLFLLGVASLAGAATQSDRDTAAARIRFIEGQNALVERNDDMANAQLDDPIVLGATVRTGDARLEVATLDGQTLWVEPNSDFHFETAQDNGQSLVLFLGRGELILETGRDMSLVAAQGSVYLPKKSAFYISKPEFGDTKTNITTLSGEAPAIMDRGGILPRFKLVDQDCKDLRLWAEHRKADWNRTVRRLRLTSDVTLRPPLLADTEDGQTRWVQVDSVKPLRNLSPWVNDFGDVLIPSRDAIYTYSTLWFLTGLPGTQFLWTHWRPWPQYYSLKWDWNVAEGWHAALVYDPLAGFGAEYAHSPYTYLWDRPFWGPRFHDPVFWYPLNPTKRTALNALRPKASFAARNRTDRQLSIDDVRVNRRPVVRTAQLDRARQRVQVRDIAAARVDSGKGQRVQRVRTARPTTVIRGATRQGVSARPVPVPARIGAAPQHLRSHK